MRKWFFRFSLLAVLGLAALAVGVTWALGSLVQQAVIRFGPQWTHTDVQLSEVSLSPWTGKGELKGFLVGNPKGYLAPAAVRLERASLSLDPVSLFADKLIIRSIRMESPEITIEGGYKENNWSEILHSMRKEARRSGAERSPSEPGGANEKAERERRWQVDEFIIEGARVRYAVPGLGGQGITFALPRIEVRDLGREGDGVTMDEILAKVLNALTREAKGDRNAASSGSSPAG